MESIEPPRMPEITEENLSEAQPSVRALLVGRYEEVWDRVKVRIIEDQQAARPMDPRFLEIGMRALKEIGVIYRLSKPAAVVEEEEDPTITGIDRARMVAEQARRSKSCQS